MTPPIVENTIRNDKFTASTAPFDINWLLKMPDLRNKMARTSSRAGKHMEVISSVLKSFKKGCRKRELTWY
jgi:hypothetical protein